MYCDLTALVIYKKGDLITDLTNLNRFFIFPMPYRL